MRRSWAVAPTVRASQIVAASVSVQPWSTSGMTTAGLNTANAAATTLPGTWPMTEPRLQKYAGPSGAATPPKLPWLAPNPSRS
jgi:hypothetical protein